MQDGEIFTESISELGLRIADRQAKILLGYLDLVYKWNRSHNLVGTHARADLMTRHLLDCLAIVPHIRGGHLLDVGSGAGLPGFPCAIACPDLQVTTLDSRRKRTEFQKHAAHCLGLGNVEIICSRVETYRPERNFDTLACRAFTSLAEFARHARPLCNSSGRMLAMKGTYPEEELAELEGAGVSVLDVVRLEVPGLDAERCLVIMIPD